MSSLHYTFLLCSILTKIILSVKTKGLSNHTAVIKEIYWDGEYQRSPIENGLEDRTSQREEPLLTALIFRSTRVEQCPLNILCEKRFALHPHVHTQPFENQERRTLRISTNNTVLYLNVFVMCNILYYRFAVLAQFFKRLFSFFYNLKKKIDVIFLFVV